MIPTENLIRYLLTRAKFSWKTTVEVNRVRRPQVHVCVYVQ